MLHPSSSDLESAFTLNNIAIFLGLVAVLPSLVQGTIGVSNLAIGGTGVLIAISVVLEIIREIEGDLLMSKYEGYTKSG